MTYKLWTTNELLTSTDMNNLSKQTVISCTSGTKPTPPVDGMLIWETDNERYVSYNATLAAWVPLGMIIDGTFTPTLTATTTNPTLGTGSTSTGKYTLRNGKWCDLAFTIKFGSSGANAGSGQYLIAVPFTSANDMTIAAPYCGGAYLRDDSGPAIKQGMTYISPNFATLSLVADNITVTNSSAWTWANLDSIAGGITYRIA